MDIEVRRLEAGRWEVKVGGSQPTTHEVGLSDSYYEELAGEGETPEGLIERSFRFLLEREPNTSILPSFDLSVIGRYFPEYEDEMKKNG